MTGQAKKLRRGSAAATERVQPRRLRCKTVAGAYDNGVPLQLVVSKAFADQHSLRPGAAITTVVKDLEHTTLGVNGLTDEGVAQQLWTSTIAFNSKTGSLKSGATATQGKTWTNEYFTSASAS